MIKNYKNFNRFNLLNKTVKINETSNSEIRDSLDGKSVDFEELEDIFIGETEYGHDYSDLKKYFPNFTQNEDELYFNVYYKQDAQYNNYSIAISLYEEITISYIDGGEEEDVYTSYLYDFNSDKIISETISIFKKQFPKQFEIYKKEMEASGVDIQRLLVNINLNNFGI